RQCGAARSEPRLARQHALVGTGQRAGVDGHADRDHRGGRRAAGDHLGHAARGGGGRAHRCDRSGSAAGAVGAAPATGDRGGLPFWRLHRDGCGWPFPAYLGAGATAGVLLVLAELITRLGGRQVYTSIGRLGPADRTYAEYVAQSRLDHAMIVLFVGAIVAL